MEAILEVLSPQFRRNYHTQEDSKKRFIQTFDFRHRNQLSKDSRKNLERIHDGLAKEVAAYLNNKLRSNIRITLNRVKQFSIEEFYEILHNPSSIFLLNLTPQRRNVVFEFRPDFSFYILDRLLGGPGSTQFEARELTVIEQKIMHGLLQDILMIFRGIWEKTAEFEIQIQNYYSSGDYLQFVRRGDSVVSISYQVSINEKIHLNNVFNITYPFLLIEELIPVIQLEEKEQKRQATEKEKLIMRDNIGSIRTPVVVDLGTSRLTVNELMKLQVGDVVMLDQYIEDFLTLRVGDHPLFAGRAGIWKNKMAFRITRRI